MKPKFIIGPVVATPGALEALAESGHSPAEFISRHQSGDWGDVCDEDRALNDEAILDGSRILSAYRLANDQKLWIITEADRTSTCLLLPTEY